ncbi:MAG: alpha/beta hydrolase [Acidimicrobiia bacterium]|nr:alpha/beta hydrolase [Acidimicrobiia bacterium]
MDPLERAADGAHAAARADDMDLLRRWVAVAPAPATLNAALCGAARGNRVEILDWLLSCGVPASATFEGVPALEWASREDAADAVRLLQATQATTESAGERAAWLPAALAVPRREGTVGHGSETIHWIEWGERGAPPIVFVHGFVGHAEWWSFIAPFLAGDRHCIALDLSGHGDSSWSDTYSREKWSTEIDDVLTAAGAVGNPLVVGHSMGGLVALATAARRSSTLRGIVVVDSPMRPPEPPPGWTEPVPWREAAPTRRSVYPTFEEAVARFRLVPAQPVSNTTLFRHVATRSVRRTEPDGDDVGWTWKFDPSMFGRRELTPTCTYLETASCPIAVVTAEHSWVVDPTVPEYVHLFQERHVPHVVIPDAHHHLLIDQPLALVTALRTLLQTWETPHGR